MEMINRKRANKVLCADLEMSAAGAFDSPTASIGLVGDRRGKKIERRLLPEVAHFS